MKKLSIIIPVFNEAQTILKVIQAVESVELEGLEKEIVIIDDFSTDGTRDILKGLQNPQYKILMQDKNYGKGAALRKGFSVVTGDYIVIQDADLEYDPNEYPILLEALMNGKADVVYGSRFVGDRPHRVLFFWHYIGNRILTLFSNIFTGLNLTDMETCYKSFTKKALHSILPNLKSNRFTIEPEITAQISKQRLRIYEVGISYYGRTYEEGKKIGVGDGFAAIWAIIKFNLFS